MGRRVCEAMTYIDILVSCLLLIKTDTREYDYKWAPLSLDLEGALYKFVLIHLSIHSCHNIINMNVWRFQTSNSTVCPSRPTCSSWGIAARIMGATIIISMESLALGAPLIDSAYHER